MKLLRRPFFLVAAGLYLVNRYLLAHLDLTSYKVPYLNDVLCLPVVLTLALWLQQKLFPRTARSRLNGVQVVFTVIYFSVFFEGILPTFSKRYTRDYWDILAYVTGGFIYYWFLNPKRESLPKPQ
ncbi:hypothetical protein AAE02nite_25620 [Adhaeribacter aerolatus]|uniref:Magnesium citrate secondary transporter n=1 Tax=Adhaeribacter aerolatus TaxID=670289 RepID=A0A512AYV2_9BACT|nr:hypothetical protein [Adhaeribacter aerolatus]GEO04898.1 hypothetical protein AAE02nite_25620 [Adhaeribacter aerolatus]